MNLAYEYEEERRTEKLNGEIVIMSQQTMKHKIVADNILVIFRRLFKGRFCKPFGDGWDVHLSEDDCFVPDVMIICNRDIIKGNGIYGPPDLIVEVLSRSTAKRDRGYKKDIYERSGVRELWLVDTGNRSVELYALENDRYALKNVCSLVPDGDPQYMNDDEKSKDGYEFSPIIFPDIIISLEEIFEDTDF